MQFKTGKYKTRGGDDAVVHFEVSEPNDTNYKLHGEVYRDGKWTSSSWTREGRLYSAFNECSADLMPPVEYLYCRVSGWGASSRWSTRQQVLDCFEPTDMVLRAEKLSDDAGHADVNTLQILTMKQLRQDWEKEKVNAV